MRQITENWWIDIDQSFQARIEEESLVLWNGTFTVWMNCWGDGKRPTKREAKEFIQQDSSPDGYARFESEGADGVYRCGYVLDELNDDGATQYGLHAFAVVDGEYLQMAVYFDSPDDFKRAKAIATSPEYEQLPA
jgi:hypothetical protein